jgi:hypothetical protein
LVALWRQTQLPETQPTAATVTPAASPAISVFTAPVAVAVAGPLLLAQPVEPTRVSVETPTLLEQAHRCQTRAQVVRAVAMAVELVAQVHPVL